MISKEENKNNEFEKIQLLIKINRLEIKLENEILIQSMKSNFNEILSIQQVSSFNCAKSLNHIIKSNNFKLYDSCIPNKEIELLVKELPGIGNSMISNYYDNNNNSLSTFNNAYIGMKPILPNDIFNSPITTTSLFTPKQIGFLSKFYNSNFNITINDNRELRIKKIHLFFGSDYKGNGSCIIDTQPPNFQTFSISKLKQQEIEQEIKQIQQQYDDIEKQQQTSSNSLVV